jgi:hypothetical protein
MPPQRIVVLRLSSALNDETAKQIVQTVTTSGTSAEYDLEGLNGAVTVDAESQSAALAQLAALLDERHPNWREYVKLRAGTVTPPSGPYRKAE